MPERSEHAVRLDAGLGTYETQGNLFLLFTMWYIVDDSTARPAACVVPCVSSHPVSVVRHALPCHHSLRRVSATVPDGRRVCSCPQTS